jgi:hypothetical protein
MSDRDIALQLADFLDAERRIHEESPVRSYPDIREHIARLARWEKLVREIAEEME